VESQALAYRLLSVCFTIRSSYFLSLIVESQIFISFMLNKDTGMKQTIYLFLFLTVGWGIAQSSKEKDSTETANKRLALDFFNDLWFSDNTQNYDQYMADEYMVHDVGDRKGVKEPAIEQKNIADFFRENGGFEGIIDFQIAEGDMVATRWTADYKGETFLGRMALETDFPIGIINVFRIKDGKIVEIWNHRHDIDTRQTMKFTIKGFLFGLLIALIPTFFAFRLKRKLKAISQND
jgi:predicted SnoaL-like aldol condensation-catalyzing enzyme